MQMNHWDLGKIFNISLTQLSNYQNFFLQNFPEISQSFSKISAKVFKSVLKIVQFY